MLPSFMYVSANGSSLVIGLIMSLSLIWITTMDYNLWVTNSKLSVLFIIFFLIHCYVTMIFGPYIVTQKHILSLLLLFFILISALLLSTELEKIPNEKFIIILTVISSLMLLLGLLSLTINIDFLNYSNYAKSIFPFAEPSHYVLAMSGVLVATGFYISNLLRIFFLGLIIIFILFYQSVLMLALLVLMIFSYYTVSFTKSIMTLLILSLLILLFFHYSENAHYYLDRLNFSDENKNLTTLVYLQGWSDAYYSFIETNGIGLGFQNMGKLEPHEISELIYTLAGEYKNRSDGGFLVAKIIGEFGFLGILLVITYIVQFFKSVHYLRKFLKYKVFYNSNNTYFPTRLVFAHSIIVSFFIEMFTRGYGYFSPGVFLFFVAIFLISFDRTLK